MPPFGALLRGARTLGGAAVAYGAGNALGMPTAGGAGALGRVANTAGIAKNMVGAYGPGNGAGPSVSVLGQKFGFELPSKRDALDIASYLSFAGSQLVPHHSALHVPLEVAGLAGLGAGTAYDLATKPKDRVTDAQDAAGLALMANAFRQRQKQHLPADPAWMRGTNAAAYLGFAGAKLLPHENPWHNRIENIGLGTLAGTTAVSGVTGGPGEKLPAVQDLVGLGLMMNGQRMRANEHAHEEAVKEAARRDVLQAFGLKDLVPSQPKPAREPREVSQLHAEAPAASNAGQ